MRDELVFSLVIATIVALIARATFDLTKWQAVGINLMLFLVFAGITAIVSGEVRRQ